MGGRGEFPLLPYVSQASSSILLMPNYQTTRCRNPQRHNIDHMLWMESSKHIIARTRSGTDSY
jgi:hypothetical protein